MFGEALLESAPTLRRRNHWPMATAFTIELIVASVLVLLPLISTGIITMPTQLMPTPPKYIPIENRQPIATSGGHGGVSVPVTQVVPVSTSNRISNPFGRITQTESSDEPPPLNIGEGRGKPSGPDLGLKGQPVVIQPPAKPPVISHTTEAMLLSKVVPEYPVIAKISGIQGEVRLHAFVSRDGTITSLSVIGNPPPVLSKAALDAVQQWKYRPYYLNGEPVEIETFITVTFKKTN